MNQSASINIQSGQLNLRQAPDSQSVIVARLSKDRPVQVLAEAGDWYRVRAGNQEGYAAKAYVALSSPLPPASPVPLASAAAPTSGTDDFQVEAGQLTFDAEGMEQRGRYFSRHPHVPTDSSGVTLGRGYDMRDKTPTMIQADLLACGLSTTAAAQFAKAAGLSGAAGKSFITQNNLSNFEISPGQQKLLFALTYQQMVSDVLRICQKPDLVKRYGATDWAALPAKVRDLVVDLRYRGDYTPSSRERLQPLLVANNSVGIRQLMADEAYWCGPEKVPQDRFRRRRDYLG
ncbi:SH3 domain-containing protein [Rheinheimera texasensis]|uniref:SH3 domain-containing protein n=1 Tax=Rheinheimera texasensis TaxID=306205 RepID=UPI0006916E86|nr:SH3 domain-containing protein [Rheinheimera texasensis]